MTDQDAIEYLVELQQYNKQGMMFTPQNDGPDTFWDCAFEHAIRALEHKINQGG